MSCTLSKSVILASVIKSILFDNAYFVELYNNYPLNLGIINSSLNSSKFIFNIVLIKSIVILLS
jgi:hypothetical protein